MLAFLKLLFFWVLANLPDSFPELRCQAFWFITIISKCKNWRLFKFQNYFIRIWLTECNRKYQNYQWSLIVELVIHCLYLRNFVFRNSWTEYRKYLSSNQSQNIQHSKNYYNIYIIFYSCLFASYDVIYIANSLV